MYTEKKWNTHYLIKKVASKKIAVSLWDGTHITYDHIKQLTQKECDFLKTHPSYIDFQEHIHHPHILDEVYFSSLLVSNQIDQSLDPSLQQKYDEFPIHFIYQSNKTEWSQIPFESVEQIIKQKTYTYKVKNEILEVQNSLKVWEFINTSFLFNIAHIKRLYHILTHGLVQENGLKYPRGFKKIPIIVNNNPTTIPEHVTSEMQSLLKQYQKEKKTKNPLQLAFDFHLRYEHIHPFENGNGRTWRFLLNKILLANHLLPMMVFEQNRLAYFRAIESAQGGNKKKYYTFMLEQYQKTLTTYWKQ